ncbi:MAG: hypothetical protein ACRDL7_02270, partial [Gaiellaceae bacterium]
MPAVHAATQVPAARFTFGVARKRLVDPDRRAALVALHVGHRAKAARARSAASNGRRAACRVKSAQRKISLQNPPGASPST